MDLWAVVFDCIVDLMVRLVCVGSEGSDAGGGTPALPGVAVDEERVTVFEVVKDGLGSIGKVLVIVASAITVVWTVAHLEEVVVDIARNVVFDGILADSNNCIEVIHPLSASSGNIRNPDLLVNPVDAVSHVYVFVSFLF